jgi:hypothetical protein
MNHNQWFPYKEVLHSNHSMEWYTDEVPNSKYIRVVINRLEPVQILVLENWLVELKQLQLVVEHLPIVVLVFLHLV